MPKTTSRDKMGILTLMHDEIEPDRAAPFGTGYPFPSPTGMYAQNNAATGENLGGYEGGWDWDIIRTGICTVSRVSILPTKSKHQTHTVKRKRRREKKPLSFHSFPLFPPPFTFMYLCLYSTDCYNPHQISRQTRSLPSLSSLHAP